MKNSQKGFVVPLLIAIIAVLAIGGGAYIIFKNKSKTELQQKGQWAITLNNVLTATTTANQRTVLYAANPKSYGEVTYERDEKNVYRQGEIITGADPDSFKFNLRNDYYHYFSKDKNSVYLITNKIAQLDPSTFEIIDGGSQKGCSSSPLVKDTNGAYIVRQEALKLPDGVDIPTLKSIRGAYSTDKNHVYIGDKIAPELTPETIPTCDQG